VRYVEQQRASIIYIEALTRLLQGQDHNGYPVFVSDCCRFVKLVILQAAPLARNTRRPQINKKPSEGSI